MCVLIIGVNWREDLPLVVAANRDEEYARTATLPEPDLVGPMAVLRPRDLRAGGTWEGTNQAGLIVVITNRPDGDFDPARRSRGLLCQEILSQPDTSAVQRCLEAAVRAEPYNSFNLFFADPDGAYLASWNGRLRTQRLGTGTHVLSNLHGLGELPVPELAQAPASGPALRGQLLAILASHLPRSADGFRICKHDDTYGTVSASLFYRRSDGSTLFEHAGGAPCVTPFSLHKLA